ncbi:MAG: TlpA disulfide reductase family protein, partial [Acidobacteriota bacterium]
RIVHRRSDASAQPASDDLTALWDGARAFVHEKYFSHDQEHYSIQRSPTGVGRLFLGDLGWLRAGNHSFWWDPHDPDRGYRFDREGAQKWAVVGRQAYHGIDCWVLEREYGWIKWYIGVERPLLHGMIDYVSRDDSDASDTAVAVQVAAKFGGSGITTRKAFYAWKETLPKERAAEVEAAYVRGMLPNAYPLAEHTLLEYKEVAPGWWFPMLQSYDLYDADHGAPAIISGSRKLKAIEVKVNGPLADELFQMEMTEGVEVSDWSHEPPLHYKYKKQFTDAEWKEIVDKANRNDQLSKKRKAAREAVVGKPAPAFSAKCEWINSVEPLTLEKLKGKVVVIDFFADWCGPCRNDLPAMAQMFKDREKLPFMVMAIHPPGSERKSIDKVIREFELGYPICIDVPAEGSWGELFAAYKVDAIPHAVVIDKEGKVAGQGQLGEMVVKARELSP